MRHLVACLVVSGYITLLDYIRVNPVRRPWSCHTQCSLLLVQQRRKPLFGFLPVPNGPQGGTNTGETLKAYRDCTPGINQVSPSSCRKVSFVGLLLRASRWKSYLPSQTLLKARLVMAHFPIWFLIAQNSKNQMKSS